MKDPVKLIKDAVANITNAINNESMNPQAAATKVAKEMGLSVNFIKRASEAVNVALTYNHFKNNPKTRDCDFDIIDAGKIAAEIFNQPYRTENQKKAESFRTCADFESPDFERFLSNKKFQEQYRTIKTASVDDVLNTDESEFNCLWQDMTNFRDLWERREFDAKVACLNNERAISSTFASLISEFNKGEGYHTPFEEFEKQAYSKFKDSAIPYLDLMAEVLNIQKRGEHDDKYWAFDDCKELKKLAKVIELAPEMQDAISQLKQAEETCKSIQCDITDLRKKMHAVKVKANSAQVPATATPFCDKLDDKKEASFYEPIKPTDPVAEKAKKRLDEINKKKVAEACPEEEAKYLTTSQQCNLPPVLKSKIVNAKKKIAEFNELYKAAGLMDYAQETFSGESKPVSKIPSASPLNNLDRKLLLQELIVTDPILSVDPKKTVDAYQQFLRVAPELSMEKEIVRSQLRQMVSGQSLSAFDADQLIKANTDFVKQKMIAEGTLLPKIT